MRALIDTCIIIDALQKREPFFENAQKIFIAAANNQFAGGITAKSSTDIYYLMHRYTHDDKASRNLLSKLFTIFDVFDTEGIDCRRAIPSQISDYEDAIMLETAIRLELDCIVTRNVHDFTKSAIPIYAPETFLNLIEIS